MQTPGQIVVVVVVVVVHVMMMMMVVVVVAERWYLHFNVTQKNISLLLPR